jgi:hypothetical protein
LTLLDKREELARMAEEEALTRGRPGAPGRQFLDAVTISRILQMRDKGVTPSSIEKKMGLKEGVVERLGGKGYVESMQYDTVG